MRTLIVMIVIALVLSAKSSSAQDEITINIKGIDTSYFCNEDNLKELAVRVRTTKGIEIEKQNLKYCGARYRLLPGTDKPSERIKDECKNGYVFQEVLDKRFFFELAPEISMAVSGVSDGEEIKVSISGLLSNTGYEDGKLRWEWTVNAKPTLTLEITEWEKQEWGKPTTIIPGKKGGVR